VRIRDKGETVKDPEVDEEGAEHDDSDLGTDDGGEVIRDKGDTDRIPDAGDGAGIRDKGDTDRIPDAGDGAGIRDKGDTDRIPDAGDGAGIRDKGDTDDTDDDGVPADTADRGTATRYWDAATRARAAEFTKAHEDFRPMVGLYGKRGAEPSTTHPSKRPKADEPSIVRTRVGRKIKRPAAFCNAADPTPMSVDSGVYHLLYIARRAS
jgi:hypothetical protein